jgi:hypothetical protein
MMVLAATHSGSGLWILFLLLVLCAAGASLYFLFHREYIGAIVAAVIAVLLAVFLL